MDYKVEIYRNGFTQAPGPEIFYLCDWEKSYSLYTYVFVIKGGGKTILIDTGIKDTEVINKMLFDEFGGKISFVLPEDEKIEAILEKAEVDPLKVDYVFLSHLHHDHSSNIALFENAKVVLSKKGWLEYMKKDRPYYYNEALFPIGPIKHIAQMRPHRVILVEEQQQIIEGINAFWVGGHTPCSMAVEVSTKSGNVVFTSDVAFTIENVKEERPIGLFYSLFECYEAYKKINERADIILTSHDPKVLDKLYTNGKIN